MSTVENKIESNYDKFKYDALVRFLTYEQEPLIRRLNLQADEQFIYITFCGREYRISRSEPVMEYRNLYAFGADCGSSDAGSTADGASAADQPCWQEANANAVLTILDLLCHTEDPIALSGTFTTLEGLNRVRGGNASTTLGDGFFTKREQFFDEHVEEIKKACEVLGAVPMGKGDIAYRIPLFGPVSLQISFYESDDEFPAQLTYFMDQKICDFLFYESLWYMINLVMEQIEEIAQ